MEVIYDEAFCDFIIISLSSILSLASTAKLFKDNWLSKDQEEFCL